jgi:starch phosphorylase
MLAWAPGAQDVRRAADELAARIPSVLAPLARLAFNYRWAWTRGGDRLFASLDADRWHRCMHTPVRLLQEAPTLSLERAAADPRIRHHAYSLEECISVEQTMRTADGPISHERPVAFFCAEYGIHRSLPIYAGGLGILAGDLLKGASDMGLPLVGVGLLYHEGYFRQRIDVTGWQHEYWVETDPERLPAVLVTKDGDVPVTVTVHIRGRDVVARIWRVDVGRVPLYLLDADFDANSRLDRWITSRLYVTDRDTRLAQYALLGLGGVKALRALGIDPVCLHLNEGHASFAPLELAAEAVARGRSLEDALAQARERTVFTTHTPVPAGNESYTGEEMSRVLAGLPGRLGTDWETVLRLGRVRQADGKEPSGMTALGLRLSRSANGVSRRHGEVARGMWTGVFGKATSAEVPIRHVTNGVHLSTWMAEPMRELLDQCFGPGWESRTADAAMWDAVDAIPDAALWAVRCQLRARLVEVVRERATVDRLARGESPDYVELATRTFDADRLTIGFARRLATYKRISLLLQELPRLLRLIGGQRPVQILLAGKAHPADDAAKSTVQHLFEAKGAPYVGERVAYLHDYDMNLAGHLVAGCDVWLNLPRPPLEASGTSGMKAALNGGVHVSVLDGWWAEGYDGGNGFAVDGTVDADTVAQDRRDATATLDILEKQIAPRFYDRDADGLPRNWLTLVRASLSSAARHFTARRMVGDYVRAVYSPPHDGTG